ncbi:MAG: type VI secretion system contractile sheath large subunit, partial [Planctomycetota bacterium]
MAEEEKQEAQQEASTIEPSEFGSLLQKEFKPKSDRAKEAVENAVGILASQVLEDASVVSDDAIRTITAIMAEIDRKL